MKYQLNDSLITNRPNAFLYEPTMDHYPASVIGCFIISDDWNEQTLLALKEQTSAYFLVGLQIDNNEFVHLDIIEGVVRCQPDEVQQVVKLLNISRRSSIAIDVVDIKGLFEQAQTYQFIQAYIKDSSESDFKKRAVNSLLSQFPKDSHIKGLLVGMQSSDYLSLDITTHIIKAIKKSVIVDDLNSFYCTSITEQPDFFRLKVIYADSIE